MSYNTVPYGSDEQPSRVVHIARDELDKSIEEIDKWGNLNEAVHHLRMSRRAVIYIPAAMNNHYDLSSAEISESVGAEMDDISEGIQDQMVQIATSREKAHTNNTKVITLPPSIYDRYYTIGVKLDAIEDTLVPIENHIKYEGE